MQTYAQKMKKLNWFEIAVIIFFWVLLFASPLYFGRTGTGTDWNNVFKIWKEHSILLVLFLINRFILLPFLFFRNKQLLYVIMVVFMISVAVSGMYLYNKKPAGQNVKKPQVVNTSPPQNRAGTNPAPPPARKVNPAKPISSQSEPVPAYINLLILSVLVFGFDTGLKINSKWVKSEQQRMTIEKENIENQLAFLKNQISPHFFMNTLNNIHSLIDIDTVEAKKSIIRLSSLMRHLLYESDHEQSPIKSEVEFIKSYVDLMKLRYSDEVRISFKIPDNLPEKSIPPLLFISLLDNAFKHGISYVKESFVEIELLIESDKLCLKISNSKNKLALNSSAQGIGIENTRKRLDLLFNENYTLEITDRGNTFVTNLTIPI
jgi:hypothetical protein